MIKLPYDFSMDKYGIHVRLVNESDAEFIVKLRTDPNLSKYIHSTDSDIQKQIQWIKEYKERENKGLDYYFIYLHDKTPIGVNRIYDIQDTYATTGSWICEKNLPVDFVIYTVIILREILFDVLEKKEDRFDVRKDNKKVIRMHKLFGSTLVNKDDIDCFGVLTKYDFSANKCKMLNYIK